MKSERSAQMGPILLAEVERQLIADLANHGLSQADLRIDWTDALGEGHCTRHLDGNLEELSGLAVIAPNGEIVAEGWMDFVHGGDDFPLFVFWLFLDIKVNGDWQAVKKIPEIPKHVWDRLPDRSRNTCVTQDSYDSRWASD